MWNGPFRQNAQTVVSARVGLRHIRQGSALAMPASIKRCVACPAKDAAGLMLVRIG